MRITDAFLGEHGVLYAQLEHIERVLEEEPSTARIHDLAGFLAAALSAHARLEDELLFEEARSAAGDGPFAAMIEEHERIEELLRDVARAEDARSAAARLQETVRLARDHFFKEEEVAFPIAVQVLGEGVLLELGWRWADRRAVRLTAPP